MDYLGSDWSLMYFEESSHLRLGNMDCSRTVMEVEESYTYLYILMLKLGLGDKQSTLLPQSS